MQFTDKELLIFDLDGTLINSALDLAIAVNLMLKKLGKESFKEEIIHGWVGNGALMLVKRALLGKREIDRPLDDSYVQKALDIFLDCYEANLCKATKPYPNVIPTLQKLKKRGYTLAIITNKPFKFVTPILNTLNMDNLFVQILGGDTLKEKKPHPMPLLHLCDSLNISISNAVMIGDSKNDILAAKACGMDSIGVTYGYNYGEDITIYSPKSVIDNFLELNNLF